MSTSTDRFGTEFEALTGRAPFPWQRGLFERLRIGDIPSACDIPTGLGKTAAIAAWLLALADAEGEGPAAAVPRRLAYVVNRRTVVDQATHEVQGMREALHAKTELRRVSERLRLLAVETAESPLAISTLRGQFADNGEWRQDPARPAVIVGTVDMIGSRLLFRGYGCGFKSKPSHAGLLGQDTLLVHDEAHLEPAFQMLVESIAAEQRRSGDYRRFHLMALTATSRDDGEALRLTAADRECEAVRKRIEGKKGVALHSVADENDVPKAVGDLALDYKDSGQAIIVFLNRLEDVRKVSARLRKAKIQVQEFTGTMRGRERDLLATEDPIFARFTPQPAVPTEDGTVFLVCTSAGEVGVNISADHLICDLTPFDSMAQRFGRVNRFGDGDARIDIVHVGRKRVESTGQSDSATGHDARDVQPPDDSDDGAEQEPSANARPSREQACERALGLLTRLPHRDDGRRDASPAALAELPGADRRAAFSPSPVVRPATDILLDSWALTSIRGPLPGRPPVADWLHGVAEWDQPETHVAWREDVEVITGDLLEIHDPADLLEDYPIKPHELLRDSTERVWRELDALAKNHADSPVWLVDADGAVEPATLGRVVNGRKEALFHRMLVLPPAVGGLGFDRNRCTGTLDGSEQFDETRRAWYDVADQWWNSDGSPRRCRVWDDEEPPAGMRLVRTVDLRPRADDDPGDAEEPSGRRRWCWYVRPRSADDEGSRSAGAKLALEPHLAATLGFAEGLIEKLGVSDHEARALKLAARWHDEGKRREVWQRSIGNLTYPKTVLAKSGRGMRPVALNHYRHELGSVLDLTSGAGHLALRLEPQEVQDLALHLVAAHHGRGRPQFHPREALDPERPQDAADEIVREAPRRYARLQRKYGRWGLAYLESLLRAADAMASQVGADDPGAAVDEMPSGAQTRGAI